MVSILIGVMIGYIAGILTGQWINSKTMICDACGVRYSENEQYCSADGTKLHTIGK